MTTDTDFEIDPHSTPYTHLDFKNDADEFQFAIVSDSSGGGRAGVLQAALEMVNRLQPEFVVSLGDLVEGYTDASGAPADEATYRDWWREIDQHTEQLEMPFFFIAGNHDLNNPASVTVWRERFGGDRQYYHFRYKDVLFLMLSTEDPPNDTDALLENDPEHAKVHDDAYHAIKEAIAEGAGPDRVLSLLEPIEEYLGTVNISEEQIDYFRGVLEANADVRWTFVMMHAPAWINPSGQELDRPTSPRSKHCSPTSPRPCSRPIPTSTSTTKRYGRDYITIAMTGAMNMPRHGAIDHIVWVTMTDDGPKISNLLLNGILDKHGPVEGDHTVEFGMHHPPGH